MKKICIVSIPRTGTNYLCSLLERHNSIDSRYEIFHKKMPFSITDYELNGFANEIGLGKMERTLKEKLSIIRNNPMRLTTFLVENSKEDILSYKIFSSHLDREIVLNEIIDDKDTVFLICKRKAIDSYISTKKAIFVSKYKYIDTTDIKLILKFKEYQDWYIQKDDWYSFMEKNIKKNGRKVETIYYEDFIKDDDSSNLNNILKHIGKLGIQLDKVDDIQSSEFIKQDKNVDYTKKVNNWIDFFQKTVDNGWGNKINVYFNEEH